MSVYVDEPFCLQAREAQAFRVGAKHGHKWSHMWADTHEELHAMAQRIGMKREWFQDKPRFPHYDLVPTRRAHAIRLGAIPKSLREHFKEIRATPNASPHVTGL